MALPFVKMHGLGNSYIYLDLTAGGPQLDYPELSRRVSDVRFGVGSDGLILILPGEAGDFRMRMFNADGSEAEMCGNGIRCVGKYVYDHGLTQKRELVIETAAGPRRLELEVEGGKVSRVRVEMGPPRFERRAVPMEGPGDEPAVGVPLEVEGRRFEVTGVSMGNPHCVIFAGELTDELVRRFGPAIETHGAFPRRTNVEFVRPLPDGSLAMRVWERGTGETAACGTGACAAGAAAILHGLASERVVVHLPGGELEIEWRPGEPLYMTGAAEETCRGELTGSWLASALGRPV